MNYEESLANVNVKGRQSLILEGTPLLNHIMCGMINERDEPVEYEPTLTVISVLCGACCEGDYIIIGKDLTEEGKIREAYKVICKNHDFNISRYCARNIVKTIMHLGLLQERLITWG